MTQEEAEIIGRKVEYINKKYAPIKFSFDMYKHISRTNEENWLVTIVYNYTEEEWMAFATINPNYSHVLDRLTGFEFGMEAVQAYQEEYGNLNFSQSDAP